MIFSNILLEAIDGGGLRVMARDYEGGISCFLPANVERPGGVLLPEKLLKELIDQLPAERIDFYAKDSNQRVEIKCARSVANIPYAEMEGMPPLRSHHAAESPFLIRQMDPSARSAQFSPDALRSAIERTTFSASDDISRPTLAGVDLQLSGISARFAATDGFRLSVSEATLASEFGTAAKTIVPASRLESLAKLIALADEDKPLTMHFGEGWALFTVVASDRHTFSAVEMETSLIDSKFPDYNAIIPKSQNLGIRVVRNELEKAIQVAGLYARDNANIVKFKIVHADGEASLKVSATSAEMGDCAIDVDVREYDGDFNTFEIAFNYKFALDYLRRASAELWMEFTQPTRPAKIQSAYDREGNDFYVLMPMQPK